MQCWRFENWSEETEENWRNLCYSECILKITCLYVWRLCSCWSMSIFFWPTPVKKAPLNPPLTEKVHGKPVSMHTLEQNKTWCTFTMKSILGQEVVAGKIGSRTALVWTVKVIHAVKKHGKPATTSKNPTCSWVCSASKPFVATVSFPEFRFSQYI